MCIQQIRRGTLLQECYPNDSPKALVPTAPPPSKHSARPPATLVGDAHLCGTVPARSSNRPQTSLTISPGTAVAGLLLWGAWSWTGAAGLINKLPRWGQGTKQLCSKGHWFLHRRAEWEMNSQVQGVLGKLNKYRYSNFSSGRLLKGKSGLCQGKSQKR